MSYFISEAMKCEDQYKNLKTDREILSVYHIYSVLYILVEKQVDGFSTLSQNRTV